jgi:hypothetical protein
MGRKHSVELGPDVAAIEIEVNDNVLHEALALSFLGRNADAAAPI